jgi:hypothetical protein
MKKIILKPTVFLILGLILIGIGLPYGIYGLTFTGGGSLGGALVLIAVIIVVVIVVIDRYLARIINTRKLNIYEIIFLILGVILYSFNHRTLEIVELNQKSEFIIVIENPGNLKNDKTEYTFPFKRKIKTDKNFVIANSLPEDIDVIRPKDWENSYFYDIYKYPAYPKVVLFSKIESKMDSIKVIKFIEQNVK